MNKPPLANPSPEGDLCVLTDTIPRQQFSRRLLVLLVASALADISLALLGLNPMSGYEQFLSFLVLDLYAIIFAIVFQVIVAREIASRVASLMDFVERHRHLAALLLIGIGIAGGLAAVWVLRGFPNSADEYSYIFGAKTFLAGRLWNPLPPLHDLFSYSHIVFWDGKWVTVYPPGWPLLLATVMGLRLPAWLASPLCGGVLLIAVMKLGEKRDGPIGGLIAVALVALSPFFLFNAGSYFDVLPAATAGLLFCWAGLAFLDDPRWSRAIFAGAALGVLGLIRNEDVLLFGLPFAGQFLLRAERRHYRRVLGIIFAGLPFLAALCFYNYAVFSFFLVNRVNVEYPDAYFGSGVISRNGDFTTLLSSLKLIISRMVKLVNWSSPPLVLSYVVSFAFTAYRRRLNFLDIIFPIHILFFMMVDFTGGNQYGPRYYFAAFPLLVLTIVSALVPLLREAEFSQWRPLAVSLAVAHFAVCLAALAIIVPFVRTVVSQRMDIYDQVKQQDLSNAVVVIRSTTGAISGMHMDQRDLTRNGIAADAKVLYVLNIPDKLRELRLLFPDRQFYIYERDLANPKGKLRRLW